MVADVYFEGIAGFLDFYFKQFVFRNVHKFDIWGKGGGEGVVCATYQ